ncbi:MAG: discoidin domain-containing protein [Sedimentisphaerales bacterium]|nr:discoidin domain-containing protein [Sedimentisphaerales bacterium]
MLKNNILVIIMLSLVFFISESAKCELVAHYPLDGNGNDITGNGFDGTEEGGPLTYVMGVNGQALSLTAQSGQYILTEATAADLGIDGDKPKTVMAWVNNGEASNTGAVWDVGSNASWWINGQTFGLRGNAAADSWQAQLWGVDRNPTGMVDTVGTWTHIAFVYDGTTLYIYSDGNLIDSAALTLDTGTANTFRIGQFYYANSSVYFNGLIDDVKVYNTALTESEIKADMFDAGSSNYSALLPKPKNGATDVELNTLLSWTPGKYADTHNVYFGTDLNDVNDSTIDVLLGDTVVSPAQAVDANTFDPGIIKFGKTYYWRVDEVNEPGDDTVFKGTVWSFTVEPYSYKIPAENIINVTASSSTTGEDPNNTKNESGLNPENMDIHSNESETMWISSGFDVNGVWIRYDFDKAYKLHEMQVWNYNIGFFLTAGFKDVNVEYSVDDQNWIELTNVPEFTKGTGLDDYEYNTVVDFNGVTAQSVRLTANSNWSGGSSQYYGLSEVRFMYIPVWSSEPNPEDGTIDVPLDKTLSWRAGRNVAQHYLYIDTDMNSVAENLISPVILQEASYAPILALGQTYYWKIDEVNEAEGSTIWDGPVWSFSTPEFLLIEDFEDYNDTAPYTIYNTWNDALDVPAYGGSQMGHTSPSYAETNIVYNGRQSAPFYYDNSDTEVLSETVRTFDTAQNWAHNGADTLRLYYYGQPGPLTVSGNTIAMSGGGSDLYTTTEQHRFAYKTLTGDGSITVCIDSMGGGGTYPKVGIMIRSGLEDGAPLASLFREAYGSGAGYFRNRTTQDGSLANATGATLNATNAAMPLWLRLTRSGTTITAETSVDGIIWKPFSDTGTSPTTATITMANEVCIGLFISANSTTIPAGGLFSNVSTSGTVTGDWTTVDIGGEQNIEVVNTLDTMYISLTDSSNISCKVKAPEFAVFSLGWTEWLIPYTDFVGVDMTRIKKITLGVGDPANTMKGEGLVYIDYISYGHPYE